MTEECLALQVSGLAAKAVTASSEQLLVTFTTGEVLCVCDHVVIFATTDFKPNLDLEIFSQISSATKPKWKP